MAANVRQYHTVPFAPWRRMIADVCDVGQRQNTVHGLLEVDVTVPRTDLREHKARTGESRSFTGYIVHCLAQAVAEDKQVQAFRQGRKLVIFEDVDVAVMIEGEVEGRKLVVTHIVRAAQDKSFEQINDEIRAAQAGVKDTVRRLSRAGVLFSLPWWLRNLVWRVIRGRAQLWANLGGTVAVTAVGMFGRGRMGWGLPITTGPLTLTLGGIAEKPAVVDGRVEPREMLCMTISFDHDIIDGAPAVRFVSKLTELLETGHGLNGDLRKHQAILDTAIRGRVRMG